MIRKCSCGMEGPVAHVFGWRNNRGEIIPQYNCRACRFKIPLPNPVQWMYKKLFPGDKNGHRRSENFMRGRILKKPDLPPPTKSNKTYSHIARSYTNGS